MEIRILVRQPLPLHLGPDHEGVHGPPDPLLLPGPLVPAQDPHTVGIVRPASPHHPPASSIAGTVAWNRVTRSRGSGETPHTLTCVLGGVARHGAPVAGAGHQVAVLRVLLPLIHHKLRSLKLTNIPSARDYHWDPINPSWLGPVWIVNCRIGVRYDHDLR